MGTPGLSSTALHGPVACAHQARCAGLTPVPHTVPSSHPVLPSCAGCWLCRQGRLSSPPMGEETRPSGFSGSYGQEVVAPGIKLRSPILVGSFPPVAFQLCSKAESGLGTLKAGLQAAWHGPLTSTWGLHGLCWAWEDPVSRGVEAVGETHRGK